MPTPTQQQAMIEEAVRTFIDGFLNNSSFSRSWNAFLTQSPEFAAAIYEVVNGTEYTGGSLVVKQGTITTTGPTAVDAVNGFPAYGNFNITVWGMDPAKPWNGVIQIERSLDGGANWVPVLYQAPGGNSDSHARFLSPFTVRMFEPETGALYRLNCEATFRAPATESGGANYRFSQ